MKFEPSSFKLTHEMVILMGGRYSQGYQLFQQLTVKAFLAIRPYMDQLITTVQLMLDTSLPSFKGEPTIQRLRNRFAPGLNERQAAEFMVAIVRNAHENVRSTAYDEFQRVRYVFGYLRCFLISRATQLQNGESKQPQRGLVYSFSSRHSVQVMSLFLSYTRILSLVSLRCTTLV